MSPAGSFIGYRADSTRAEPVGRLNAIERTADWPRHLGVHNSGRVGASVTDRGRLGTGYAVETVDPETGRPAPSFEFPIGSGKRLLFGGAIWIGGIIDNEQRLSIGTDGWRLTWDFYPVDPGAGSLCPGTGRADESFHATYTDTVSPFDYLESSRNLNCLVIEERSHSWTTPPYDDFVIFENIIRNTGSDSIHEVWVGLMIDADVYASSGYTYGWNDDLVGLLHQNGIAYIIDNDGDPDAGHTSWPDTSSRHAIGVKFIETDPPATDTGFNWWVANYNGAEPDWGPRFLGEHPESLYQFSSGGNGFPYSDSDKYHLLSNSELDYDYIQIGMMSGNPLWLEAPPVPVTGFDCRFLYSVGSFELPPGDSIRIAYALLAGENVHVYPDNLATHFDPLFPEFFYTRLDFSDLINNCLAAVELHHSGYEAAPPLGPVQGLRVSRAGNDSATTIWQRRIHPDLQGYNLYLSEVPEGQVLFGDTVVGPRDTTTMMLVNTVEPITDTLRVLSDLTDGRYYFVSAATVADTALGRKSQLVYFSAGEPRVPQVCGETIYLDSVETVTVSWSAPPDNDVAGYNIYRYRGWYEYNHRLIHKITRQSDLMGRPYDRREYYIEGGDSTAYYYYSDRPYATVPAGDTCLVDSISGGEYYYLVTAFDSLDQESDTSRCLHVFVRGSAKRDFLVMLYNDGRSQNLESVDSVVAYYERILSGFSFDFFFRADSMGSQGCQDGRCFEYATFAPYRYVVIDDNLRYPLLMPDFEILFPEVLADYCASGGNVVYFGCLPGETMVLNEGIFDRRFTSESLESRLFGLDSAIAAGFALYPSQTDAGRDTLGGFIGAEPIDGDFPQLKADTSFYWWNGTFWQPLVWPITTPPTTGNFFPATGAEPLYLYRSLFPLSSRFEGWPCGIRYTGEGYHAYAFAFHPWFLEENDSRALFEAIEDNITTGLPNEEADIPDRFSLAQNYPNPFNPATRIEFTLPVSGNVYLGIYNIRGRRVRILVDDNLGPGVHEVSWDGTDQAGYKVASGIYFYLLKTADRSISKKMLLLK